MDHFTIVNSLKRRIPNCDALVEDFADNQPDVLSPAKRIKVNNILVALGHKSVDDLNQDCVLEKGYKESLTTHNEEVPPTEMSAIGTHNNESTGQQQDNPLLQLKQISKAMHLQDTKFTKRSLHTNNNPHTPKILVGQHVAEEIGHRTQIQTSANSIVHPTVALQDTNCSSNRMNSNFNPILKTTALLETKRSTTHKTPHRLRENEKCVEKSSTLKNRFHHRQLHNLEMKQDGVNTSKTGKRQQAPTTRSDWMQQYITKFVTGVIAIMAIVVLLEIGTEYG
jgi:hypothetical protein